MAAIYKPLEPTSAESIGGVVPSFNSDSPSFATSIEFLYFFFFSVIVVAAFYRYLLAGIKRMQASEVAIRSSNDIFKQTTLGLLGIFSLFLILSLVNKDLISGNFSLLDLKTVASAIPASTSTPSTGGSTTGGGTTQPRPVTGDWGDAMNADPAVRARLNAAGISISCTGGGDCVCKTSGQTNCTTVGGLPEETLVMLESLKRDCGGSIIVTGGTEAGHSSHGPKLYPVDLGINIPCIRSFPRSSIMPKYRGRDLCYTTADGPQVYEKYGYVFCDEQFAPRHWHVFKR